MAADVTTTPASLTFAKGDGRLSPTLPAAGAGPLLVRLAPSVSPEEVAIVLDTEVVGYPFKDSTVNIVQVRITSTGDVLSFPVGDQQDLASVSAQLRLEFANGTVWDAAQVLQQLGQVGHATSIFLGSPVADAITGDGRNLTLQGLGGDDTLTSSSGNETLVGGAGSNQYVLNAGWGQDRIVSDWSRDTVVFGPGLTSAQAKATAWGSNGDVRLSFANSTDSVILQGLGLRGSELGNAQGYLQFADGTRVGYLDLFRFVFQTGSERGEQLRGGAEPVRLQGLGGNDQLYSGLGADTLEGGAGDDVLYVSSGTSLLDGGSGNDQFVGTPGSNNIPINAQVRFGAGSGHDTLGYLYLDAVSNTGKTSVVVDASLKASDVSVYQYSVSGYASNSILLRANATGDSLQLDNFMGTNASQADIRFADGTVWSAATLLATPGLVKTYGDSVTVEGTAASEVLSTVAGKSTYLNARGGSDTILVLEGPGDHTLNLYGTQAEDVQTVQIKGHVNPQDVRLQLFNGSLLLDLGGASRLQVSGSTTGAVVPAIKLAFDDGTVWSQRDIQDRIIRNGNNGGGLISTSGADVYGLQPGQGSGAITNFKSGVAGQADDLIRLDTSDVSLAYVTEDKSVASYHNVVTDIQQALEITFNATGEKVRVYDARYVSRQMFYSTVVYDNQFFKSSQVMLELADGSRLTGLDVARRVVGASSTQAVLGSAMDDTLRGGSGNDTIDGGAGDDTIVLSQIAGSFGQDVVLHQLGGGRDTVIAKQDEGYTLRMGSGISVGDVYLTSSQGGTLALGISGTADQVVGLPARVEFADGTVLDQAAVLGLSNSGQGEAHLYVGTQGQDEIRGRASDDTIRGGGGNDTLDGQGGNDVLLGGDGEDQLYGGLGSNTFVGGAGNDSITTQSVSDTIEYNLGDGTDAINAIGSSYTLKLGAGITPALVSVSTLGLQVPTADDPRQFTYGSIFVNGLEALKGSAPAKIVFADGTVWGPAEIAAATLKGTPLGDRIQGGTGNDVLTGLAGNDTLDADAGNDTLDGGAGDDVLVAGLGKDVINFGRGDGRDDLTVGDTDTLQFKAGLASTDLIYRKAADGTLHVDVAESMSDGVAITSSNKLAGLTLKWADGTTLAGATALSRAAANLYLDGAAATGATLQGGAGDDWITAEGSAGVVGTLLGGKGRDVLVSNASNLLLDGGEGNDVLFATAFSNTLIGGAGADQFILKDAYGTYIDADGQDLVRASWAYDAKALRVVRQGTAADDRVVIMNGDGVTSFVLGHFSQLDTLRVQFTDGTVLTGAQLKPLLIDQLPSTETTRYGSIANDQIVGAEYSDYISGGRGNDFIDGGASADEFRFSAGDGQDTVHADSLDNLVFDIQGLTADGLLVDRIDPNKPKQVVIHVKGSTDSVTIDNLADALGMTISLAGTDTRLTGAQILALANKPAALTLTGTTKADTLTGKDGDDTLSGLAGNDTLAGGKGNDSLIGGKGNDTYVFNRGDGQDVIVDTDSTLFNSDLLKLGGATSKQLWLTKSGSNLDIKILGTQDKVTVQNWFAGSSNVVEKITASDGKSLSASKVNALVNAMASFTPPADAASLPANTPATITKLVASSWV